MTLLAKSLPLAKSQGQRLFYGQYWLVCGSFDQVFAPGQISGAKTGEKVFARGKDQGKVFARGKGQGKVFARGKDQGKVFAPGKDFDQNCLH